MYPVYSLLSSSVSLSLPAKSTKLRIAFTFVSFSIIFYIFTRIQFEIWYEIERNGRDTFFRHRPFDTTPQIANLKPLRYCLSDIEINPKHFNLQFSNWLILPLANHLFANCKFQDRKSSCLFAMKSFQIYASVSTISNLQRFNCPT